jgi:hypothetical protein
MDAKPTFPTEEYNSITVSIDHLNNTDRSEGDPVVCKCVFSTQNAFESVMAQLDYFGMNAQLQQPAVFAALAKAQDNDAIVILNVEGRDLTNIIVDADVWAKILARPEFGNGSVLQAHGALIVLATEYVRSAKQAGDNTKVLVYLPDAQALAAA